MRESAKKYRRRNGVRKTLSGVWCIVALLREKGMIDLRLGRYALDATHGCSVRHRHIHQIEFFATIMLCRTLISLNTEIVITTETKHFWTVVRLTEGNGHRHANLFAYRFEWPTNLG